ncbi:MAG TPA: PLP-dependent aminotransferase family protein [Burkholderiaceae bacterium]|nr:PLP-dependent aminotransferase family protein [Burkholderiaceae bacterium]
MEPINIAPVQATASLPDFVLRQFDQASPQPDHRQLYGILQRGIRDAVLPAGLMLPPTRQLCEALGIARNTVVHVYEQLALEGYVQAGIGRGTFVAAVAPRLVAERAAPPASPSAARGALLSRRGGHTIGAAGAARVQWGAFTPGVPEVRLFPAQIWNRLHARLWRSASPEQLTYATGAGDAGLRESVAEYLQGTRGVVCTPEQVVITSGTQQSLYLVQQLLADPGDAVWLEDPGYWGARSVFSAGALKLVPVGVDAEGLAPSPEQLRRPPRLMFVSPSHQYPTGVLMSYGRRRQLLDYAAAHGVWVVEDDYDSEFRYGARPLPALQGLDRHGRVIYLGTFSKTLFPALRLAYLVLPPDLVEPFARALNELFREGQTLQQAVLARFLAEGHYATHIRRMRAVYGARHDALVQAIARHFGDHLPVIGGDAGLHLVLGLPPQVDDDAVAQQAQRAGVTTRPLSLYHMRRPAAAKGLLLGYGAVREEEVAPSFAKLAKVLQRSL